jgi:hypothetical protein
VRGTHAASTRLAVAAVGSTGGWRAARRVPLPPGGAHGCSCCAARSMGLTRAVLRVRSRCCSVGVWLLPRAARRGVLGSCLALRPRTRARACPAVGRGCRDQEAAGAEGHAGRAPEGVPCCVRVPRGGTCSLGARRERAACVVTAPLHLTPLLGSRCTPPPPPRRLKRPRASPPRTTGRPSAQRW